MFLAAAKGLKYMEGQTKGCWGRPPTLGRVLSGLNLIHGPLGKNKMTHHRGQKTSRYKIDDCGRLRTDMDVRSDPLESRLDKLSMKYLNGPIRVCIRPWRPSQVVVFLQSEYSPRESFSFSVLSLIHKQNNSARVSTI